METAGRRTLILVTSYPGQPGCAEFARQAAAGERPRKDYVELARLIDADVVDDEYMTERATRLASVIGLRGSRPDGQVLEAALRGGGYAHICAWTERIGLPLALLHKMARLDRDLTLVSSWLSGVRKALLLRQLRAHTHVRAIVSYGSAQIDIAAARLGVPRHKLHLVLQPVDERFWRPSSAAPSNAICAVGSSGRDYETLFAAFRGLDAPLNIALGAGDRADRALESRLTRAGPPPGTRMRHLRPLELRALYTQARFVVVPLEDVEYDAGATALTEAMAMGKALIVTRTRGQIDLIQDGVQGISVPPGDPRALRAAIDHLVAHPDEAERMGRAGRALAEERHTLDSYIERLAEIVRGEQPASARVDASRRDRMAAAI
jgi:glycosyltransferase involved in cell wall biosynthesis